MLADDLAESGGIFLKKTRNILSRLFQNPMEAGRFSVYPAGWLSRKFWQGKKDLLHCLKKANRGSDGAKPCQEQDSLLNWPPIV